MTVLIVFAYAHQQVSAVMSPKVFNSSKVE